MRGYNPVHLLSVLLLACGCGSNGTQEPMQSAVASEDVCAKEAKHNHPGMMEYTAGISKDGSQGVTVTLVEVTPAPPVLGDNEWTLKAELGGMALSGAKVTVYPLMVDHGHSTPTEPVITDNGDGTYAVAPVNFSMPGFWDTSVTVKSGDTSDKVSFGFCIP